MAGYVGVKCSVAAAFEPLETDQPARQVPDLSDVGFVTDMQIGAFTFAVDLPVASPLAPGSTESVAGVLEGASWPGGQSDALNLEMVISVANKQQVEALLNQSAGKHVGFSFQVVGYDPRAKSWYRRFGAVAGARLNGSLKGSSLGGPYPEVQTPGGGQLWQLEVEISPQDPNAAVSAVQQLEYAAESGGQTIMEWGGPGPLHPPPGDPGGGQGSTG